MVFGFVVAFYRGRITLLAVPCLGDTEVRLAGAMLCGLAEEWELPFNKTALSVPDVVFPGLSFIVCTIVFFFFLE